MLISEGERGHVDKCPTLHVLCRGDRECMGDGVTYDCGEMRSGSGVVFSDWRDIACSIC